MRYKVTGMVVAMALFAGCSWGQDYSAPADREQMLILGAALTKLSAVTESTVRYKNPPPELQDRALLEQATRHDPQLLAPFSEYVLRVRRDAGHAVVLVCDRERQVSLLEDAGCSAKLDRHLWKTQPPAPCEFTLTLEAVCHVQ